jgi:hypothetical protein
LHDEEQYDLFAFGAPDGPSSAHARRAPAHRCTWRFFAESWFELRDGKPAFRGMGVGYWDAHVPNGDAYGVHSARLATGLSYVEAIDPSPKAVRKVARTEPTADYLEAYRAENASARVAAPRRSGLRRTLLRGRRPSVEGARPLVGAALVARQPARARRPARAR